MNKQLVCEGRCGGPHTGAYDAAVRALRACQIGDGDMRTLSRRLVHTPHEDISGVGLGGRALCRCLDCGAVRTYGWPWTGASESAA